MTLIDSQKKNSQISSRSHNSTLVNKTKFLNDTDFIIRMLYKYSY